MGSLKFSGKAKQVKQLTNGMLKDLTATMQSCADMLANLLLCLVVVLTMSHKRAWHGIHFQMPGADVRSR